MNDYYTGGYTCASCGEYVMHGTIHVCKGQSTYPPYIPVPALLEAETDPEILKKLDKIIELLKKIQRRL